MTASRERLEAVLANIDTPEPVFTRLYPEAARAAADAADARRRAGISLGPLDGKLLTIKDLFDVAGEATTAGSAILKTAQPATADAIVVQRLRQAGAVIFAKTNMTEFAYSGLGLNPHYGTPRNAIDPARVPGGSSCGAGVAVARGWCDIAIGSDTGGSVRIPAAFNDVVGFKPTARRIPRDGAFPLSYTLDSIGPLAMNVADCAFAKAIMAGEIAPAPETAALGNMRIGVPGETLLGGLEPAVEQAFETALGILGMAGANIADFAGDNLMASMAQATGEVTIASAEATEIHAERLETRISEFDPRVANCLLRARGFPASKYIRMIRRRNALAATMDARLAEIDILVAPTVAVVPPLLAPLQNDDDLYFRTDDIVLRNTAVANAFDLTAITLPIPGTGLPAGLMLMARHGQDRRLLAIATAVEKAFCRYRAPHHTPID